MTIKEAIDTVMSGEVATVDLNCGTVLTITPQTNIYHGGVTRVDGFKVEAKDPFHFATTDEEESKSCGCYSPYNSDYVCLYIGADALPVLALLVSGLNRKVYRQIAKNADTV
jgi:hypothetical protein